MKVHSYLSPKCIAKPTSSIHRNGVFAVQNIKKGELIALWGGYIITVEELRALPRKVLDYGYPVQVYENFFLGPKTVEDLDDAEMFNHSCDPNAGVKGQNVLVARRDVAVGEEICFDYETTDTQEMNFTCKCSAKNCRKQINGQAWMKPEFQKRNKGYLSLYIEEKIKKLKYRH